MTKRTLTGEEILKLTLGSSKANVSFRKLMINQITQDTRKIEKGSCFICIKGSNSDGHELIKEAEAKGAVLIVAERSVNTVLPVIQVESTKKALAQLSVAFFEDPSEELEVIGVTGTNGKTTITHMINQILNNQQKKTGLIGTMYNKIGEKKIPTINTTPDAFTNQKLLREMKSAEVHACIMEVSSHALIQGRVWGVDFDVAVFTNLTQDHLEFHHTMEEYFHAKSLLFSQLGNSYHKNQKKKTAIINIDDPYGKKLLDSTAAQVITYGCKGEGTIQAEKLEVSAKGTRFTLRMGEESYPVQLQMVGEFNVYNALAAASVCYRQGLSVAQIIHSLEQLKGVKGRFELVPNHANVTVIVDYAHTPDGLINVLDTIKAFASKEIYCVVGCGGDRDASKRPIMAEVAVTKATHAIFTSDNPRTEDPERILSDMTVHLSKELFTQIVEREKAIEYALSLAKSGDVVLIAGKGHEDYQIIGTTKYHFDDVEIVKHFFTKRS